MSPISSFVSRFGGDEFAIVLDGGERELSECANLLLRSVRCDINFSGVFGRSSLTIGGALYPNDGFTEDDLMRRADIALYQQKINGKNGFRLFEDVDCDN
ncbi:diguanylate cyclase domain-containing protein [Enterobacter soli]|uniref:diguanylate cyclase domain-containing protein n=1 Tax=Enterobacter soli TaxID=885040 RepID=UPI0009B67006